MSRRSKPALKQIAAVDFAAPAILAPPVPCARNRWRRIITVGAALVLGMLIWHSRATFGEALHQLRSAQPAWLVGALALVGLGYLVSSQVFGIVLRALGQRIGAGRLWLTAVTAIVITQCAPAGAVGGYAFLLATFRRRRVPAGQAALLATLEALSYVGAMLLVSTAGLVYLALQRGAGGPGALAGPGLAIGGVVLALCGVLWLLSRSTPQLRRWLYVVSARTPRRLRRVLVVRGSGAIAELGASRALVMARPGLVLGLIGLQSVALLAHSLALLCVLYSLGAPLSIGAAVAAFGAALITSTFNLLPGGGGTVEAVLAGVLVYIGAGPAAVPAAIVFRLINFWALLPIAAAGYVALLQGAPAAPSVRSAP